MDIKDTLSEAERDLLLNASTDDVTGVLNRSATMSRIEEYLLGEGRNGTHALIMIDMDNLKQVNDTLGHQSGDSALRCLAQNLLAFFRKSDIVGRIGGDEFFAFVKNINVDTIGQKVSELINGLQYVFGSGDKSVSSSASAGVAIYYGNARVVKSLRMLYSEADAAMYRAKSSGKNTFALAAESDPLLAKEYDEVKDEIISLNLHKLLDNLGTGIVIFHGESADEITPRFCNEGYLKLSGLTYEEFKNNVVKQNLYGVHPDDISGVREKFVNAYINDQSFQATIRVKSPQKGYHWISVIANIKHGDMTGFDVYMVFSDAENEVRERQIVEERYRDFVERRRLSSYEALSATHINLTQNSCRVLRSIIKTATHVFFRGTVDEFIVSASENIDDPIVKADFLHKFNRKALLEAYDKGVYDMTLKNPVRLSSGKILWCRQTVSLSENPLTGDVEAILCLMDADRDIRIQSTFERMMVTDYEFIANINISSGIITMVSRKDGVEGLSSKYNGVNYNDVMPKKVSELVRDEFVSECKNAFNLQLITSVLEKKEVYICTFPANDMGTGDDAVYQCRFSYMDKSKKEIILSCTKFVGLSAGASRVKMSTDSSEGHNALRETPGIPTRNKILIADDSPIDRDILKIIFGEEYSILEAVDGEEAIRLIDANHENIALILLDLIMPKKTGLDVLMHIKMSEIGEKIPVMMVTGESNSDFSLQSLEYGISDIIFKPFNGKIVKRRAKNLIELYASKEDVEYQLKEWKQEALEMHLQAAKNDELLINALSSVVEFRNSESGLHVRRVQKLTEIMLKSWMLVDPTSHFSENDIDQISRAAALHDIGKVAIPDSVLLKPGKLSDDEYELMKEHTIKGCDILARFKQENSDFYQYCYDICRYHHERSDGKGYPDGLTEEQIPIWAQIVSFVDVFDALISPRVYKDAFDVDKAIDMIKNGECGSFSQKLLKCFETAKDEIISTSKVLGEEARKNSERS